MMGEVSQFGVGTAIPEMIKLQRQSKHQICHYRM